MGTLSSYYLLIQVIALEGLARSGIYSRPHIKLYILDSASKVSNVPTTTLVTRVKENMDRAKLPLWHLWNSQELDTAHL